MRRVIVLTASILVLSASISLVATAQARYVVETVDSGSTHAELAYDKTKDRYGLVHFDNIRVHVERVGSVLVDEPVPRRCGNYCGPANGYLDEDSIHLRDLNRDGAPDVVVDLYTGGAHCCFLAVVYGFNSKTGVYQRGTKLLNEPYRVRDLDHDGLLEFRGVDGRFDYRFDCYACSRDPIQIWRPARLSAWVPREDRFVRRLAVGQAVHSSPQAIS